MSETVVRRRAGASVLAAATALTLLAGCSGGSDEPDADPSTAAPTSPPTAAPPPKAPVEGTCYELGFRAALAPTNKARPTPCGDAHTSETYAVGTLYTIVDGHLLAVDSERVQAQVAEACPEAITPFLGGDPAALRLSMVRPVWFTPTVAQSDLGADWYRCDVVVVAGDNELAELDTSLEGAFGKEALRERYAMCGTAAPDDDDFERVMCGADHTWRAIEVVPYAAKKYPGEAAVRSHLASPCEDAGLDAAEDPLDYQWGYEYPTEEQWDMGQTYGLCWAPD